MVNNKNKIRITLFSVSLFLILISAILFCVSKYSDNLNNQKTVILTYLDNNKGLKIDNTSPITDALGKKIEFSKDDLKTGYVEFSLSSDLGDMDEVNYELCVKEDTVEKKLSSKYIKLYLTDANTDAPVLGFEKDVPSFYDLKVASSDINSKGLYKGTLKNGEVKDFRLRMWLSDLYTINNEDEFFNINLMVKVID